MEVRWAADILGKPEPKGSTRAFMPKGGRFPVVTSDNPKLKDWQTQIRLVVTTQVPDLVVVDGPVRLTAVFKLPAPKIVLAHLKRKGLVLPHLTKPDLDKCLRAILDALTGVSYRDDSQVVAISATKQYAHADEPPRVWLQLESER